MTSVGVSQEHGVRQMLAQHVGIADWNHVVEDTVYDQTRLSNLAELAEALAADLFPDPKGRDLRHGDRWAGQGLAIFFTLGEPGYECLARGLTRRAGWKEEVHQFLQ